MGSRTPVFPLSNGLNPSFMPTQQRPNRALTESLADQFHLIRQLYIYIVTQQPLHKLISISYLNTMLIYIQQINLPCKPKEITSKEKLKSENILKLSQRIRTGLRINPDYSSLNFSRIRQNWSANNQCFLNQYLKNLSFDHLY
ncbi:Hypothetical_protein [Hexamita inflata]|uniref:Hypothetical_protein n=1 Tax=Hexamita inflata TaxID=28002 RepID=A0AA86UK23_9EUKA|nr:Hypothetical protein HINF_LOCUS41837 [Hexamita inflata]